MKFVVDASVAYDVVFKLRSLGHEVLSIVEKYPPKTPDETIFDRAIAENAVLITRDQDFTNTIRYPPGKTRGGSSGRPKAHRMIIADRIEANPPRRRSRQRTKFAVLPVGVPFQ